MRKVIKKSSPYMYIRRTFYCINSENRELEVLIAKIYEDNALGKLSDNYLKRKANGKQKEYEERTKAKKKSQIDEQREQIRADDREKGIYFHAGVPNIPRAGKQAVM